MTKLILVSREHASVLRETITPALPGFISNCLNLIKLRSDQDLRLVPARLNVVLQSFIELLPSFPNSFRPYLTPLRELIFPYLAPTSISAYPNQATGSSAFLTCKYARRLLVLTEVVVDFDRDKYFETGLKDTVLSLHKTADLVFRSLIEEWTPHPDLRQSYSTNINSNGVEDHEVKDLQPQDLPLPGWRGIWAGLDRLDGILQTLQAYIAARRTKPSLYRIHDVLDALDRVMSAIAPATDESVRAKPGFSKDEREALSSRLPSLHVSAMKTYHLMALRFGVSLASIVPLIFLQMQWVFDHESMNLDVRQTSYDLISHFLSATRAGLSLHHQASEGLLRVVQAACNDLDKAQCSTGMDPFPEVTAAASKLLATVLSTTPDEFLSMPLRAQIERIAILTKDQDIMLAGAMNPPTKHGRAKSAPSILPFLVRQAPAMPAVEALIRPQMPVIRHWSEPFAMESPKEEAEEIAASPAPAANEEIAEPVEPVTTVVDEPALAPVVDEPALAPVAGDSEPRSVGFGGEQGSQSDSSDFEIPKLDTGFSSDEEEDDEDVAMTEG